MMKNSGNSWRISNHGASGSVSRPSLSWAPSLTSGRSSANIVKFANVSFSSGAIDSKLVVGNLKSLFPVLVEGMATWSPSGAVRAKLTTKRMVCSVTLFSPLINWIRWDASTSWYVVFGRGNPIKISVYRLFVSRFIYIHSSIHDIL